MIKANNFEAIDHKPHMIFFQQNVSEVLSNIQENYGNVIGNVLLNPKSIPQLMEIMLRINLWHYLRNH